MLQPRWQTQHSINQLLCIQFIALTKNVPYPFVCTCLHYRRQRQFIISLFRPCTLFNKWADNFKMVLHVRINISSIEVYNNQIPHYVEASYSIGTTKVSPGLRRPRREADHAMWSQSSEWVEPYITSAHYPVQTASSFLLVVSQTVRLSTFTKTSGLWLASSCNKCSSQFCMFGLFFWHPSAYNWSSETILI